MNIKSSAHLQDTHTQIQDADKISLTGLMPAEMEKIFSQTHLKSGSAELYKMPYFRYVQIYKWITRGISGFDQMTDIPVLLRRELKTRFSLFSSAVSSLHDGKDAKKIVLSLKDGLKTEAVLLCDGRKRFTACLSTQAGCPAGCVFCKTGSLGFHRNLTAGEIIEQFFQLNNIINLKQKCFTEDSNACSPEHVSNIYIDNIVIMGMGEPLLNMSELRKAILFFSDSEGLNLSKRRITVSTCGIYKSLSDIAENGPYIRLALSLTTADEQLRNKLMPVTAANPLINVKEALVTFQQNNGGRVTLEVPLLGGINTRGKDTLLIAKFAMDLNTVINIIPWNPVPGLEFEGKPLREPDKTEIKNFISQLESHGLKVTIRRRKGRKTMAACGQLGAQ